MAEVYSYSKLTTFEGCQFEYYLNYILKLKSKQNIYGFIGGKVHEILEDLQAGNITNDEAIGKFDGYLEDCEIVGYKFPSEKTKENFVYDVKDYFKNFKPSDGDIVKIEEDFIIDIGDIKFRGIIDKRLDGKIIDYKTSSKFKKKDLDEKGIQLVSYAYATEQMNRGKVDTVGWDMIKYVNVSYGKRTRMLERIKVLKELSVDIKKQLEKLNIYESFEIDIMMKNAEENNSFDGLPDEIKNRYTFDRCIVEYPYNNETKKNFENFIDNIVSQIDSKDKNNEDDWKPREITQRDSFYCGFLCGHRDHCKHYKKFIQENADNFEKKEEKDDIDKLFG